MRIKLAIILTAALLLSGVSVSANGRLDVEVTLEKDGSAHIREIWDMTFNRGTEWYLVRDNLGDISITNFSVSDENGLEFFREEDWDTDRSLGQKAGRCGIIKRKNGCELCWGLGSHGNHVFDVRYTMTNVVKSANDYDYLHIQFVSQGIDPAPDIVKVTVRHPGTALDTSWARVWAYCRKSGRSHILDAALRQDECGTEDWMFLGVVHQIIGKFVLPDYCLMVPDVYLDVAVCQQVKIGTAPVVPAELAGTVAFVEQLERVAEQVAFGGFVASAADV